MACNNNILTGKIISTIALVCVSVLTATSAFSASDRESQLIERIAPVGNVCIEGDECGGVVATVAAASNEPRSGQAVYDSSCFACHATGAAGAPKTGDTAGWAPRIATGIDSLVTNAINGVNAMPPMGTCMACSDDEIRNAVQYMVDGSQ